MKKLKEILKKFFVGDDPKSETKNLIISSVIVMGFTLIYNLCFFNSYIPFSEGWYTFLARVLSDGNILYKDIPFVFPPAYVYLIKTFIGIFGESFIYLRVFGVISVVLVSQLVFLLYREFFSNKISALGTILAMVLFMESPVYLAYDYYPVYSLFALSGIYFFVSSIKHFLNGTSPTGFVIYGVLGGFLACSAFLIRQSSGFFTVLLPFFAAIFVVWRAQGFKKAVEVVLPYVGGVAIISVWLFSWLFINESFAQFVEQCSGSASSSKGGAAAVLFGWGQYLDFSGKRLWGALAFVIILIFIIPLINFLKKPIGSKIQKWNITEKLRGVEQNLRDFFKKYFSVFEFNVLAEIYDLIVFIIKKTYWLLNKNYSVWFIAVLVTATALVGFFCSAGFSRPVLRNVFFLTMPVLLNALFLLAIISLIIFKPKLLKKETNKDFLKPYMAVVILTFSAATIWGIATSLAVSLFGTYFFSGLILAYVLEKVYSNNFIRSLALIFLLILPVGFYAQHKANNIYDWYGLGGDNIKKSKHYINNKYLKGIRTTKEKKEIIEDTVSAIHKYTNEDDKIFVFSQIPIFYVLADRKPVLRTIVHWFDVCPDPWVYNDMEILNNNLPKVIVYEYMGDNPLVYHEKFFRDGAHSAQRHMMEYFDKLIKNKDYTVVSTYNVPYNHYLFIMVRTDVYNDIEGIPEAEVKTKTKSQKKFKNKSGK